MKLTFHEGKNFGDALNPLIFHHFLGETFFDNDSSVQFLGIGSILGLKKSAGKKIVFSSGYAAGDDSSYGAAPIIDNNYDVVCVRGPKTAKALNLSPDKAVTDGAVLLPCFYFPEVKFPKYKYSLILHHKSLDFYNEWSSLCEEIGIHLIDVRKDINLVLSEIVSSEKVFCEAMHGAIVADSYRIPWLAVNFYPHINFFKWQDWCESLLMNYNPQNCYHYLHDVEFLEMVIKKKTHLPSFLSKPLAKYFLSSRIRKNQKFLNALKLQKGNLSNEHVLQEKQGILVEKIEKLKAK